MFTVTLVAMGLLYRLWSFNKWAEDHDFFAFE